MSTNNGTDETILYWPMGGCFWKQKVVYGKGYMLDGQRHGRWTFWYKTGQKQLEGEYSKGKKTGRWTKWTPAGAKLSTGEFLYGKMNGTWVDWYENGQRSLESHWVTGKRDGKWTYWDSDGSIKKKETYHHEKENDLAYTIHTDLEVKELVRDVQREHLNRAWERLVGRLIANLIKPWHVASWLLCFVPLFAFMEAKTPWRGAAQAALISFVIISVIAWALGKNSSK